MILYILFIIVLFFLFLNKRGIGVEGFTQDTVINDMVNANNIHNTTVNDIGTTVNATATNATTNATNSKIIHKSKQTIHLHKI